MKPQCKNCIYYKPKSCLEGECSKFRQAILRATSHCGYFKISDGGTGLLEGFKKQNYGK
jgi:hypothetical protein